MYRLMCAFALSLLSFVSIAREQQPSAATPGPAARALSFVAIGSAKLAVVHGTSSDPGWDRECVLQLDDYALSGMFEELLRQQLSEKQLADADRFYSTPFAAKYNQVTLQQVLFVNGKKTDSPIELTASEVEQANSFSTSEAGNALTTAASQSNAETASKLRPALVAILGQCRTDR
ncbi:hypothetical protein [Montanilutibacter psychrotolerans]|uniref:hypothetical protein n=1 Tax=Montanilutibacter psychrotolerans TaxID=1327343 RepID=UPI0011CDE8F1|nr:hypothetical protein [Lysobacter psychrotolerans]